MHTSLESLAQKIDDQLQDGKNLRITIGKEKYTIPVVNNFVLLFYDSFITVFENYNLTLTDIKVIFKIMSYAQFGNLISLSHTKIANDLGIKRPNVSASIKKLKISGLLIDDGGNIYLNPQIISKGSLAKIERENKTLLEQGAELIKNSIGQEEPNIKIKAAFAPLKDL